MSWPCQHGRSTLMSLSEARGHGRVQIIPKSVASQSTSYIRTYVQYKL